MATKTEQPVVSVNDISRISAGTTVQGEISSPVDIRIDGNFEGRICSQGRVVIGEKAMIKGNIICQNADFWGTMTGNFFVRDTITLKSGCTVNGDLNVKRIQVELDAQFNGSCRMISEEEFDRLTAAPDSPDTPDSPGSSDTSATEE